MKYKPRSLFYVVSDVYMGRAEVFGWTAESAAHHQYLEVLHQNGFTESSDQGEVLPEQFRAWPCATWPHHLSFEEAFEWIGRQRKAA